MELGRFFKGRAKEAWSMDVGRSWKELGEGRE